MNKFHNLIIFLITLLLFYYLFSRSDISSVINQLSDVPLNLVIISLVLSFQMPFIQTLRLKIIFKSVNLDLSFKKLFLIIAGSYPFVAITPSRSGDFVRSYYLRKEINLSESAGSVISERIFDIISLLMLSSISLLTLESFNYIYLALIFSFTILFITFLSIFKPKIPLSVNFNSIFYNLLNSYSQLLQNRVLFSKVLFLSMVQWSLALFQTYVFFLMIKIDVSLLQTFALAPLAIFLGQLPLTLGGMGTRDLAFINLFSEYATESALLSVGILFSIFRYWLISLLGIPFMLRLINNYGSFSSESKKEDTN